MTDTFKSGQRRICAGCLAHIEPKDRVCVLYDEIHCMTCLTADEEKAADDLSSEFPYYGPDVEDFLADKEQGE